MKPLAKFRVYAWQSSLFFDVYIWKYKKEMHANWNRDDQPIGNCMAFVHPYVIISSKGRKQQTCGEIHFWIKRLGTEIITHESTHAAMVVLRRLKFNFNKISDDKIKDYMKHEEIVAYCVGYFSRQIVDKIYKLGILSTPTRSK